MEWAAAQHADVVNLSLSSAPSRGDDPVAVALDNLTADTGILFVAAAGNRGGFGANPYTIGSPGVAASALTVGAVDAADKQASFSSEGPTLGSYRLKPDLVAPGVNILGAKAGARDGNLYVPMSGTSQATPIVAGAAALLLQQDPDRTWQQLKAQLTNSADPTPIYSGWTHGSRPPRPPARNQPGPNLRPSLTRLRLPPLARQVRPNSRSHPHQRDLGADDRRHHRPAEERAEHHRPSRRSRR